MPGNRRTVEYFGVTLAMTLTVTQCSSLTHPCSNRTGGGPLPPSIRTGTVASPCAASLSVSRPAGRCSLLLAAGPCELAGPPLCPRPCVAGAGAAPFILNRAPAIGAGGRDGHAPGGALWRCAGHRVVAKAVMGF